MDMALMLVACGAAMVGTMSYIRAVTASGRGIGRHFGVDACEGDSALVAEFVTIQPLCRQTGISGN